MSVRRLIARLLPPALVLAVACGVAYAEAQLVLRSSANDPQLQLATDAAHALDGGATPASVTGPGSAAASAAGGGSVDVATSLAPFVAVYDTTGAGVASNALLDGRAPVPPAGVLAAARATGRDVVTWEPRPGVRIAAVVVPWSGGTLLAGRSLREVEAREDQALQLAIVAGVVGLLALLVAGLVAEWLAPAQTPRE